MTENPPVSGLRRDDAILLFHWHYYDGPLEGALEWGGTRYWFSADPDCDDYGQILRLMVLTPQDWERVDAEQTWFENHVGRHTKYDRETQRRDLFDQGPHHCECEYQPPGKPDSDNTWVPRGRVAATVQMWEHRQ